MSCLIQIFVAGACLLLSLASPSAAEDKEVRRWWFEVTHDPAVRIRITAQDGGTLGWDPTSEALLNTLDPASGPEGTYTEGTDGGGRPRWYLRFGFCSTEAWPLRLEVFRPATARAEEGRTPALLFGTLRPPQVSRTLRWSLLQTTVLPGQTRDYRVDLISSPQPTVLFEERPTEPRIVVAAIRVYFGGSGMNVQLIDSRGRRTGQVPGSSTILEEIPESGLVDNLWPGADEAEEAWMLSVGDPADGTYTLRVFGATDAKYDVAVVLTDHDDELVQLMAKGTVAKGQTVRYTFDYRRLGNKGALLSSPLFENPEGDGGGEGMGPYTVPVEIQPP